MTSRKTKTALTCMLIAGAMALVHDARAQSATSPRTHCPNVFLNNREPLILIAPANKTSLAVCNGYYSAAVFPATRTPMWSAEHMTTESVTAARGLKRPDSNAFKEDTRLPESARAHLIDYRGSVLRGYDRGHMVPSGDTPDMESRIGTYLLSNVIPQASSLNRGVWEKIEEETRHLAIMYKSIYVVTGPGFVGKNFQTLQALPSVAAGKPSAPIYIPTYVWKAIYVPTLHAAGVYVCQNIKDARCSVVPIGNLIAETHIDPFPDLPDEVKKRALNLPRPGADEK